MPLHVSSTMCSSSGGQNCIVQHLVSSQNKNKTNKKLSAFYMHISYLTLADPYHLNYAKYYTSILYVYPSLFAIIMLPHH